MIPSTKSRYFLQITRTFLVKRAKIDLKNETYVKVAKKEASFELNKLSYFSGFFE